MKTLLHRDQRGVTTVEYLVLMLCVLGCAYGAWRTFGRQIVDAIGGY